MPVYLGLCRSAEELRKECRRLRIDARMEPEFLADGASGAVVTIAKDNEVACIVCIGDTVGISPIKVASTLVHEAVHVWQQVKRALGETDPSDEFEAYSIGTIAERLFDAFVESEKK